jgi:hypothetical protein
MCSNLVWKEKKENIMDKYIVGIRKGIDSVIFPCIIEKEVATIL